MVRGWIVEKPRREVSDLCRRLVESLFVKVAFEQRPEGSEGMSQADL